MSEETILDTLGLSVRAGTCLREAGILTVGELSSWTEEEMLQIPHFGRKSLLELKEVLSMFGLRFATMSREPIRVQPIVKPETEANRDARRRAHTLMAVKFDVGLGCYRDEYSDERIATDTGASLAFVIQRREQDFGPIKTPPEIPAVENELRTFEARLCNLERDYETALAAAREELAVKWRQLEKLTKRTGWSL